jgi:NADH-quinone oxidoreductase subunit G
MPKLTIDGKEIEVPKGTKIIEAAKRLGIDIPYYCYHPALSVAGNCRMCLVEIERSPKLQIACHSEALEGMKVWTDTPKVRETKRHILEFLLVNHPVDCPVCDQAGECWLQDYYMNYGAYSSRLDENKIKKQKAVSVGPTVMLDSERCILCSRCVRFLDEITKTSELGILRRGDHCEIAPFPGRELKNPYSGNVVDLCPVGALTDKDFRFKVRAWYLEGKPTLCNGCARGCNIDLQYRKNRFHHAKGQRVMRIKPRFNASVNQWWICDAGRYGYKWHDHERILKPSVRCRGELSDVTWDEGLSEIAERILESNGKIMVFLSPQLSCEEIFAADKFFKNRLKIQKTMLVSPKPRGEEDAFLICADKNPNSKGAEWLGYVDEEGWAKKFLEVSKNGMIEGAILFGQDLMNVYNREPVASALGKLKWTALVGANHHATSAYVNYVLPSATYLEKEGTFVNCQGRVQKFGKIFSPLGEARPELEILRALAGKLGIDWPYQTPAEIFGELTRTVHEFDGFKYEELSAQPGDVRKMGEPMIPAETQASGLIFNETKIDGKAAGRTRS